MYKKLLNVYIHQHERYLFGRDFSKKIRFYLKIIIYRNLIPVQRKVLEAIQDELSYGKGREITTINAIYDRLGMSKNFILSFF